MDTELRYFLEDMETCIVGGLRGEISESERRVVKELQDEIGDSENRLADRNAEDKNRPHQSHR